MGKGNLSRVLITGANGFIGRHLCAYLKEKGYFVRAALRCDKRDIPRVDEYIQVGEINGATDWQQALTGVEEVVHLAGRAHILNESNVDPLAAFREVNVLATKHLASMAVKAGVKRFVFMSSVKVNGEGADFPYSEKDVPAPRDAYGISKKEAEDALASIAAETGLEMVVLRPPLVYGPGVKANFRNLIKIAGLGMPLPLGGIRNQRSFIHIGNLVDAIGLCIIHPLAAGETFLVSDGQDISTLDLIKMIATALNKKAILFPLPPAVLKGLAALAGQGEAMDKLTGSLRVDCSKIRALLGWKPPYTLQEGIKETAKLTYNHSSNMLFTFDK